MTRGVRLLAPPPDPLRRRLLRGRLPARPARAPDGPARSGRRCARTRSPTATAGRPAASSAPRWTPPRRAALGDLWRRFGVSVGRRARAVARVRLVARRGAAAPEHVVDGGRGRARRARRRAARRRARAQARISTSSGEPCSSSSPRVDPGDERRVELEHAVDAQHVRDEVVGEQRERGEVARGREPVPVQVGGGDLRALEERDGRAVVGARRRARSAARARRSASATAEPSPARASARNEPPCSRATCAPSSRSARREQGHQLVPGVLAERRGAPRRRRRARSSSAVHGPLRAQAAPRRCGSPRGRAACAAWGTSPSRS